MSGKKSYSEIVVAVYNEEDITVRPETAALVVVMVASAAFNLALIICSLIPFACP